LTVFNVYEPPNARGTPLERAERIVFVKDGFLWLAAIFPALWLLVKGLWLELVVFVLAVGALTWGFEAVGASPAASAVVVIIVQVVFGYEAGAIYGAALERRGWRPAATVAGRDQVDCERRFFEVWLRSQPAEQQGDGAVHGPVPSWTDSVWQRARDAMAIGRRLTGAKA